MEKLSCSWYNDVEDLFGGVVMLEKYHIEIPKNQCTSSVWFDDIIKFIRLFDYDWTLQLQPGDFTQKSNMIIPVHCYPADYYEFLLHAGKSGCEFQTPLLRHQYFSIMEMEENCKKYETQFPQIYQTFASLNDEYVSSLFTFDDEYKKIQCQAKCPGCVISNDFRHLFCCSVFLDFGIRQFAHRIGFAESDMVQISDFIDKLKKRNYMKQWFSTVLNQVWINDKSCCVISRELSDTLHISLFYNDMDDCDTLSCFLRSTGWEEDDFFANFPQWK